MTASEFLKGRGWTRGSGGSYYLPGGHPHIHAQINPANADVSDDALDTRQGIIAAYRVLWTAGKISMIALSRGAGRGGNQNITLIVQQDGWEGVLRRLEKFEATCLDGVNNPDQIGQINDHIITMRDELELMNAAGA